MCEGWTADRPVGHDKHTMMAQSARGDGMIYAFGDYELDTHPLLRGPPLTSKKAMRKVRRSSRPLPPPLVEA